MISSFSSEEETQIRCRRQRINAALSRWQRDESGSLVILGMFIFLSMLTVSGIAVDLMNYERLRSKVQILADQANFAAASQALPNSTMTTDAVISDQFDKAGLANYLTSNGQTGNSFTLTAAPSVRPIFTKLLNINGWTGSSQSQITAKPTDIEVSLALDISGNMAGSIDGTAKFDLAKNAANTFAATLLADDTAGRTSVSLIPFGAQISLGPQIAGLLSLTPGDLNMTCVDFTTEQMAAPYTPLADPDTTLTRSAFFDPTSDGNQAKAPYCPPSLGQIISPIQADADALQSSIGGLEQTGAGASLDSAIKWAYALLRPESNPIVAALADQGTVPSAFGVRPMVFNGPTQKVVVLVAGGGNGTGYALKDNFKSGLSPVFERASTGALFMDRSLRGTAISSAFKPYYRLTAVNIASTATSTNKVGTEVNTLPSGTTQLSYDALFAQYPVEWIARHIFADGLFPDKDRTAAYNEALDAMLHLEDASTKDFHFSLQCNYLRGDQVRVFTVAFGASDFDQKLLANCASVPGDFFAVTTEAELIIAMRQINRQIRNMRLVP